ncbi:MAG: hypothetical protein HZA34_03980 [Candidatus Pacebacteria bacterium]|nr:hypothetical protein [Candidatus Paceibacterota bacterium]
MQNGYFPGQQSDERVLYEVKPHVYALYFSLAKLYVLSLILAIFLIALSSIHSSFFLLGLLLGVGIAALGTWIMTEMYHKNISYITDRRIVRFEAATPFATNVRALTWDEVVKVKTFPRNVLWKSLMIGTVIIHAGSTYVHTHVQTRENVYTNDDLDLEHVYYYKDLGNYIDKVLYTYKHKPAELAELRPFVPKPTGQRY